MGKTWDEFKSDMAEFKKGRTWLLILVLILIGLAYNIFVAPAVWSVVWMLPPDAIPAWGVIAFPAGLLAIFFGLQIRAARKRGERNHLRVSDDKAKTR